MTSTRTIALPLACLLVACGAGADDPGGAGGAGFTAVVDGQAWAAEPIGVTAIAGGVPGGIVVVGTQISGALARSLTLTLGAVGGPGTYALGVGPGIFGGTGAVGEAMVGGGNGNTWLTPLDGRSGSVTVTILSATRLVATFQFTGEAGARNPLGGKRAVTNGKIDLPLTGTLVPVPDKIGSRLSAVLGGQPFNASFATGRLKDFMGGAGVAVDTTSSENGVSLMLAGVTAPGTYALSTAAPLRTLIVGRTGGDAAHCCWGLNGGEDTGSVTITSLTATRVKGSFTGTLLPQPGKPATTPLVVNGEFDVGID